MENVKTNHDNIILKAISNKDGKNDSWKIRKLSKYPNISDYLDNRYNDSLSRQETILRMRLKIEIRPICPTCGNKVVFTNKFKKPFTIYCCHECSYNAKEKLEKYKQTCLNKYGYETPLKDKEKRKIGIETSLRKYGVDHPFKSEVIKEKYKKTCIEKYNVDWISKSDIWKTKMSDIMSSEKVQYNRNLNLKEHNSFNSSKPEEELFLYIKSKFPTVKRQYRDKEKYPWQCDFYIPELNYFIELNGNWTHGKHPYNKNNVDDKNQLELWKSKYKNAHKYYLNAIKTWTIYDVNKRETAKRNNLNFKEVWSLQEGKDFIDKLLTQFLNKLND